MLIKLQSYWQKKKKGFKALEEVPGTGGSLEYSFFLVEWNPRMKKKEISKKTPPTAKEVAKGVAWKSWRKWVMLAIDFAVR